MKYKILFSILLMLPEIKSDDINFLKNVYDSLSAVYEEHPNKRESFLSPDEWNFWSRPMTMETPRRRTNTYDFIVVGSGSAGSVIANRLSEIKNWHILLLEAGKRENLFAQIPLAAPVLSLTDYNWNYIAEFQPNMSSGFKQHRMLWPRGKALGGTTVINFMIYTRGNPRDYDRWAAQGNPGWSYEEVLPYFIKSEDAALRTANDRYHGRGGYLSVEDIYQSELVESFIEAGRELGLPFVDYNAHLKTFGVSTIQATVSKGRRHSVATAFLQSVRRRSNLHVLTSAYVTKILIDPDRKQAYGVEYERGRRCFRAIATKEVILSAGTFNSPQLLMLAGIGPKKHLQELGIPVLKNLPVGQNLQDHITFPGLSFLIDQELSLSVDKLINATNIFEYLFNGTGPYTSLGGVEGIAYINTELSQDIGNIPNIELLFIDGSLSTDYGLFNRQWMNIRDDIYNTVFAPNHNIPSWTIFPLLLYPKSRGYLKLRSRNPYDYPLLYGNYFSDPEEHDINTLIAAIRVIQRIAATKAFQKHGSRMNGVPIPGCEPYIFNSDDYWKCALRSISVTLHHQVGTAKMGPIDDPSSIVNNELKVYGIERLRVADCSVIPFAVGAHTSAVSIMIGEKAADMIKDSWRSRQNLN